MKKNKPYIKEFLFIIIGSFILALGINMFLAPNKISSGGISSIGTILLHLFGVKMSITNLVANIILFIFGFKYLGKYAVVKTAAGIAFLTLFLELTSRITTYNEDMMLATVVGGVLVGLGVGLVVRPGASTGGSDFAALIIKRFAPHFSLANIILVIDCAVIIISGIVFKSVTITIFSVISMYISSKVTDAVVTMGDAAKAIQIFSSKNDEIASRIMAQFERGVTGIYSKGMYSQKDRIMLLCVVSPKELPIVINVIRSIDSSAFIVINDAREVLGEGFKEESSYDQIQ